MAGRQRGSVRPGSDYLLQKEVSASRAVTPSVAFGDISPSGGRLGTAWNFIPRLAS